MTEEDRKLIKRIDSYAQKVLKDTDPQKTRTSFKLQQMMPIIKAIAAEEGVSAEDMFVKYMDLQTQLRAEEEGKFKQQVNDPRDQVDISSML